MEKPATDELTAEQKQQFDAVDDFVAAAIQDHCESCSTAQFAPKRLAGAVATGRVSLEATTDFADRLAACAGQSEESLRVSSAKDATEESPAEPAAEIDIPMCHLPPSTR